MCGSGAAAIAAAAALAMPARLGARRSVLAGDVARGVGQLGEGGSNLDQLAGAGAAVELAGAVLAVLALDRGARAGRRPGAARRALRAVAVIGAHELDDELDLAGALR